MPKIEFDAKLVARGPKGAWVFLDFPVSASRQLGSRGRVPVRGTMNGHPFRISAFPTGDGTHQIAVNKILQAGAEAVPGERVRVVLEVDIGPRVVTTPPDLKHAIAHAPQAKRNFDALSYGHKKAYVEWILEAKRPETRARRVNAAVKRLSQGKGHFY